MIYQMVEPVNVEDMKFFNSKMKYKFFIPEYMNDHHNLPVMLIGHERWYSRGNLIVEKI